MPSPVFLRFIFGAVFLSVCHCLGHGSSQDLVIDEDAIRQLSEVFDVANLKLSRTIRSRANRSEEEFANGKDERSDVGGWSAGSVPSYMLNLYNTIADSNGVMRIPNPFNANLIQSFPNKYTGKQGNRLQFDLDSIKGNERVLHAELHLQLRKITGSCSSNIKSDPSVPGNNGMNSDGDRKVMLSVYQLMTNPIDFDGTVTSFIIPPELISKVDIVEKDSETESDSKQVIPLKSVFLNWIRSPEQNFGLLIDINSEYPIGDSDGCESRYETDNEPGRQPSLVVFMDDGRTDRHPKYRIKSLTKQTEYLKLRTSRLGQPELLKSFSAPEPKLNMIQPSSEGARFRRSPASTSHTTRSKLAFSRSIKSRKKYQAVPPPTGTFPYKPKTKGPCRRHDLYVSFQDIGWSSWIISPKGFQAYHCRGDCRFPIGQESKPSNHATVISIINHMKFHKRVAAPCCVPDKLYSISLLYFDNQHNVILKQYDDMVAQSCACR